MTRRRLLASAATVTLAMTWSGLTLAADPAEPTPGTAAQPAPPLVAGPGPWLAWERAPELDEDWAEREARLYPEPEAPPGGIPVSWSFEHGGYRLAFMEGDATRSEPRGLLDGYEPLRLWVARPDGTIEAHVIDRAYKIRNVAIGPAGILLATRKGASDGGIVQLATAGWPRRGERARLRAELQPDGTVTTNGSRGLPRVIEFGRYRDKLKRIGLRRADLAGSRWWLWRDDSGWTRAQAPPGNGHVLATDDGYFTLDKRGRLHFSADLADWQLIYAPNGSTDQRAGSLTAVGRRLVYSSQAQVAWVEPDGLVPTPFGEAVGRDGPLRSLGPVEPWSERLLPWPGEEAGLVLVDLGTDSALFTPDGRRWGLAPLAVPLGWGGEFELRDGDLVQYDLGRDGSGWSAYRAVVTSEPPTGSG